MPILLWARRLFGFPSQWTCPTRDALHRLEVVLDRVGILVLFVLYRVYMKFDISTTHWRSLMYILSQLVNNTNKWNTRLLSSLIKSNIICNFFRFLRATDYRFTQFIDTVLDLGPIRRYPRPACGCDGHTVTRKEFGHEDEYYWTFSLLDMKTTSRQ